MAVPLHFIRQRSPATSSLSKFLCNSSSLPSSHSPVFPSPYLRPFSSSSSRCSKIGRLPLSLPPGVSLEVLAPTIPSQGAKPASTLRESDVDDRQRVVVTGPLGSLELPIPKFAKVEFLPIRGSTEPQPVVKVEDPEDKHQRAMWGTTRACLNTNILGVSEGHACILRFVGVGYRASVESNSTTGLQPEYPNQQYINLKLGYGHPIELPVPKGITASSPQPTRLLLEGINKELVTNFAAEIREWRRPEPYKGKGIFINDETIKLKAKKIK